MSIIHHLLHPIPILLKLYKWLIYYPQFKKYHITNDIKSIKSMTPKYISLGKRCYIGYNARIEGVSRYNQINYTPNIIIGNNVLIQQNIHLTCANKVVISNNTAIAANVTITDIDHPYIDINTPIEKQDLVVKEVFIGEDCKIYNGAVILQNVHIGKHCVIGANSVVTKDIPDYCIAVGAPAIIIKRYNFDSKQWEKTDKFGNFLSSSIQ